MKNYIRLSRQLAQHDYSPTTKAQLVLEALPPTSESTRVWPRAPHPRDRPLQGWEVKLQLTVGSATWGSCGEDKPSSQRTRLSSE